MLANMSQLNTHTNLRDIIFFKKFDKFYSMQYASMYTKFKP